MLSIPPYVSTTWDSITSLHLDSSNQAGILIISLQNGVVVKIPNLNQDVLTKIFQTHTQYMTEKTKQPKQQDPGHIFNLDNLANLGFPMRFGGALEGLGAAMQHNPEQSQAPDLPKEVLEKISAVAKIMDTDQGLTQGLKPEPHCNCVHCQIARAITQEGGHQEESEFLEEVSDEELKFRSWDISQSGEKLYTVSSPLDAAEHYSVHLGDPIGCTCGQNNCEHIKAVLNS